MTRRGFSLPSLAALGRLAAVVTLGILGGVLGTTGHAAGWVWPHPAAGDSPTADTEVLFTFDDGPNVATTPAVLDILAQRKIHAVFFLVGRQIEDTPKVHEILQRIVAEGHIMANHTMHHTNLCKGKPEEAIADLDGGKAWIEQVTAMKLEWFRAPFGVRCEQLEQLLAERRTFHFHWDLDPQEWRHGSAKRAVQYVTDELSRAVGRNVLLMHDTKLATVRALPEIFAWLDEENARRAREHRRPIKVLQAPDFAIERLPPEIVEVLAAASAGVRALPGQIASVLP